jgi:hypothetical protein
MAGTISVARGEATVRDGFGIRMRPRGQRARAIRPGTSR